MGGRREQQIPEGRDGNQDPNCFPERRRRQPRRADARLRTFGKCEEHQRRQEKAKRAAGIPSVTCTAVKPMPTRNPSCVSLKKSSLRIGSIKIDRIWRSRKLNVPTSARITSTYVRLAELRRSSAAVESTLTAASD